MKLLLKLVLVTLCTAALTLFAMELWHTSAPPTSAAAVQAARQLNALALPDEQGRVQSLQQWQGKLRVINLWATWCAPCRAEMPGFSRLQEKYTARDVQFIGIALDEPEQIADYAKRVAVRYPLLIGSHEVMPLFAELGNAAGAVPYTLIMGRNGELLQTHVGYWPEFALERVLKSLLEKPALSPS